MILGIDIAKEKFDVTLVSATGRQRHRTFANQASGFAQVEAWLTEQPKAVVHPCAEASGPTRPPLALSFQGAPRFHFPGAVPRPAWALPGWHACGQKILIWHQIYTPSFLSASGRQMIFPGCMQT